MTTRPAQVAGIFYPADKTELQNHLTQLLNSAPKLALGDSKLALLIAPHAGYLYSGPVAAAGFNQLSAKDFQRVVLIGVSHQSWFPGAALDSHQLWETPLGPVLVDQSWAQKIIAPQEKIDFNSEVHLAEHSLEVQLPFLQKKLAQFTIVPLLLGFTNDQLLISLADKINHHLDGQTLVVISSDLSHYPSDEIARQVDQETINAILSGDPNQWEKRQQKQLEQNYPNLDTLACGAAAIKLGLYLSQKLNSGYWRLFQYATSADASGDYGRVVGYASLGFLVGNEARNP